MEQPDPIVQLLAGAGNVIFWVLIFAAVIIFAYIVVMALKWLLTRRKKIDFLSMNFKMLRKAAEKNCVPAIRNQVLFLYGGSNNFGIIEGSCELETMSRVRAQKNEKGVIKLRRIENNKEIEYYEKPVEVHEVVFLVNSESNSVKRWFKSIFKFLERIDLVVIPFENVICERYNSESSDYSKTHIKSYNDLRGHVFLDVSSLIPSADGILRPNTFDISEKHVSAFTDQIFKHQFIMNINDNADHVRLASYSNPVFVQTMEKGSVERQAQANRTEGE